MSCFLLQWPGSLQLALSAYLIIDQMREHWLFLTGTMATAGVKKVLDSFAKDFDYTVHSLGIQVASLMTTKLIKKRLTETFGATRVLLPGGFRGDLDALQEHFGVPFERGPVDLKDLPEFFGHKKKQAPLTRHRMLIFAEINEASTLSAAEILATAQSYRKEGADVIDLGFMPDQDFPQLHDTIRLLKDNGMLVSVDTHDAQNLMDADQAGADYLLSLKPSTLWVVDKITATPIVVPETPDDMDSLYAAIDALLAQQKTFIADPILAPIHHGFARSISHYYDLRRRYPDIEIMLGTGNVTELTHADSAGMTALLLGIASELNICSMLTTQVSGHCCKAIREADLARRIMYAAHKEKTTPAHFDEGLMGLHERHPFPYNDDEIRQAVEQVRDPSYRIQVNHSGVHVYNRDLYKVATDPFDFYTELKVSHDGGHAFYLGVELARAQLAWQLGKRYSQDEELSWGCAVETKEEDLSRHKAAGATLRDKHSKMKKAASARTTQRIGADEDVNEQMKKAASARATQHADNKPPPCGQKTKSTDAH